MSAETLRRAAAQIREDHATSLRLAEDAFFLAVADWLTGEALAPSDWNLAALTVARAYLGETA